MATVTKSVNVNGNSYTFDISIPESKRAKVVRIYGDVTKKEDLAEAVQVAFTMLPPGTKSLTA